MEVFLLSLHQRTFFLLIAAILFFFVAELMYVPITKAIKLKNGTHACEGKNFWANNKASGLVHHDTFITGIKPTLTVARI